MRRGDFNTHAAHLNHVRVRPAHQPAHNTSTTITEQIQTRLDETINIGQHHHHHHYKSTSAQMCRCLLPAVLKPLCFQSRLSPPRTAASSCSIIILVNPQQRNETRVTSLKTCSGCECEVWRVRVLTVMCLISAHVLQVSSVSSHDSDVVHYGILNKATPLRERRDLTRRSNGRKIKSVLDYCITWLKQHLAFMQIRSIMYHSIVFCFC